MTPQEILNDTGRDIFSEACASLSSAYDWRTLAAGTGMSLFRHSTTICALGDDVDDIVSDLSDRIYHAADRIDTIYRTFHAFVRQSEGDDEVTVIEDEAMPNALSAGSQYLSGRQTATRRFTQRVTPYEVEAMERTKEGITASIMRAWSGAFSSSWVVPF